MLQTHSPVIVRSVSTARRFAPRSSLAALALLVGLGLLPSCGGDELVLPEDRVPSKITITGGDEQPGMAGAVLPVALQARVTDASDRPAAEEPVVFEVLEGGAGADVAPDTARTDANGVATTRWTLGAAAGVQRVRARVVGEAAAANLSVVFTANAGAAGSTKLVIARGDAQTATAGSPLPDSLVVAATDQFDNPVAGVVVSWTVTGGGSVSAEETTTGADGRTGVVRVLGPAVGPQTTVATAEGLTGSPITFTATATVGAVGKLVIERQPSSSAQSGVAFSQQPRIQLRDANDNPVTRSGIAVTATIATQPAAGGASLSGSTTAATNSSGLATFSGLGINGPAGDYTLSFAGEEVSGVQSSTITIGAGAATRLSLVVASSSAAQSGVRFDTQPEVQLVDASGNAVAQSGITVTATLAGGGGGTLNGDRTIQTNGQGRAVFTDLAITGPPANYTILFAANGLIGVAAPPVGVGLGTSTTEIQSILPATTVVGQSYTVSVRVTGSGTQPTGTVAISDGTASCDATLSGNSASCALASASAGTKSITATYNGDATHGGSSDTEAHQVNRAATSVTITGDNPDPSISSADVTVAVSIVVNSPGAGTPTGTITVSGGGDSCTIERPGSSNCTLNPSAVGTYDLSASYEGDANFDSGADTEQHQVLPVPVPDLTINKTHSGNFAQGSTGEYSIVVSNEGNASTSGTITVTDQLPTGLAFQSGGGNGWSCSGATTVVCTRSGSIGVGEDSDFSITVTVASDAPSSVTNSVTLSGGGDISTGNNSDDDPTTIEAPPPPPNQAPIAANDAYSVDQDQSLTVPAEGVLANDSDPDDGPGGLQAVQVSGPSDGTLTLNSDGSFTYTPNPGFAGEDSFTYRASDGDAQSASASVTITVNAAPVGTPVSLDIRRQPPDEATSGEILSDSPAVRVRDSDNRDLSRVPVRVSLEPEGESAGTLGGTLEVETGEDGVAEFDDLVIELPAEGSGEFRLRFEVVGASDVNTTSDLITVERE